MIHVFKDRKVDIYNFTKDIFKLSARILSVYAKYSFRVYTSKWFDTIPKAKLVI